MKKEATPEDRFCEVMTQYYGEKLSSPGQLTEVKLNGFELLELAEFYFWYLYPERMAKKFSHHNDTIFRQSAIIRILLFVILILILNNI